MAFPPELPSHLPRTIHLLMLVPDPLNNRAALVITLGAGRARRRILLLRLMEEIRRRGDRQDRTDRLDPETISMIIDEADHHLARRSSSAWAKYADAFFRISLDPSDKPGTIPFNLAVIYGGLGDNGRALTWLEKAYEERSPSLNLLKLSPAFTSLRGDARFDAMVRGLDMEAFRGGQLRR
jgi:hypothetical protein